MSQSPTVRVRRKREPQFAWVPIGIARDPTLSDKAFRLWVVLESYTKRDDPSSWPSVKTLSELVGCSRNTIGRATTDLVDRGLLEIESGKAAGQSNTYILIDPADVAEGYTTSGAPPTPPMQHRGTPPMGHKPKPVEPQPENHSPAPAAPRALRPTDDPLTRHAHTLAVRAFEQPVKPEIREGGKGAFPAVLNLIKRVLNSGRTVQELERAIDAGVDVWTLAGLQTSIAHANPRQRQRARAEPSLEDNLRTLAANEARSRP